MQKALPTRRTRPKMGTMVLQRRGYHHRITRILCVNTNTHGQPTSAVLGPVRVSKSTKADGKKRQRLQRKLQTADNASSGGSSSLFGPDGNELLSLPASATPPAPVKPSASTAADLVSETASTVLQVHQIRSERLQASRRSRAHQNHKEYPRTNT
jgi:hypothetical protein